MSSRYSRQEILIGKEAQEKLSNSKLAIIGLGALGSTSSELSARAGIGKLKIIDRDIVEQSNLQRQSLYSEADIGKAKALAAKERLSQINSEIEIEEHVADINYKNIDLLSDCNLILDCSDNLYTRFLINEFSRKTSIPWIYSSAIQDYGQLMLIEKGSPCFRCLFEETNAPGSCETMGVLNTISSSIAALQVNEAIKFLTRTGQQINEPSAQKLIHLNINEARISSFKTTHNKACPACQGKYEYLEGRKEPLEFSRQCTDVFQFHLPDINLEKLRPSLEKIVEVRGTDDYLFFENFSLFKTGKVIIRAKDEKQAKADLGKYLGI